VPLKIFRRPGSPNWYMRGSVRGIRIIESTGVSSRVKAQEIRAFREAELLEQSIHGRAAVATFGSAALSYMQNGGDGRYLTPLLEHFGRTRLSAIDQAAIDRCAAQLKPHALSSTVNRQIHTPISAVLKHAAARGWCDHRSIERPRQPKGKTRWLSFQEAEDLIGAAGYLRPLLTFLLYTGCRLGEAINLDWAQVDLVRRHVQFLNTKNGQSRGCPLHPLALAALANLAHREGAVFRRPDGLPYARKPDGGGQIKTGFKGACRRAGLSDVTPHTLRHTWASWHYQQQRDLRKLMDLGGWKSLTMVVRYSHVNADQHADSINSLPAIQILHNPDFGSRKRTLYQ
jgi:integrase